VDLKTTKVYVHIKRVKKCIATIHNANYLKCIYVSMIAGDHVEFDLISELLAIKFNYVDLLLFRAADTDIVIEFLCTA